MDLYSFENEQSLLPPRDLIAEIQRLQDELIDERERNLRSVADFKNYRSRTERDGNKIAIESKRKLLLALLDIVDDMDKAVQYAVEARQPFMEGIRIIHKKFLTFLESQGVSPLKCVGSKFDHDLHEAVAVTTKEDFEPKIVVDDLRHGYIWNGELLRAAQVRVSG